MRVASSSLHVDDKLDSQVSVWFAVTINAMEILYSPMYGKLFARQSRTSQVYSVGPLVSAATPLPSRPKHPKGKGKPPSHYLYRLPSFNF